MHSVNNLKPIVFLNWALFAVLVTKFGPLVLLEVSDHGEVSHSKLLKAGHVDNIGFCM